jgi:hypothetical protein
MFPQRLLAFQAQIASLNPATQRIDYNVQAWAKHFAGNPDFLALSQQFHPSISRDNLRNLSEQAIVGRISLDQLFLATMMWGFGKRGTPGGSGAFLTRRMLESLQGRTTLQQVVQYLHNHQLRDAYTTMLEVKECGQTFATKFLYVVGLGAKLSPLPLVLDSKVAKALEVLAQDEGHVSDRCDVTAHRLHPE